MKDHLRALTSDSENSPGAVHTVREYLQAAILESLQRVGAMISLAFQGGTALRFLFDLDRFSEDLDFALERDEASYDFRTWLRTIRSDLEREGYEIELKVDDRKIVHKAFVRFPGLLHDLRLSPHPDQVLSIKLEVDTRPPEGAGLEVTVVRRHRLLRLQHHDRASLLAGKLQAILQRPFTKGRDLYDLAWYLADPRWPEPNLEMLRNALDQTGWKGEAPTETTWRGLVAEQLDRFDWPAARRDVAPFLGSVGAADLVESESIRGLLEKKRLRDSR